VLIINLCEAAINKKLREQVNKHQSHVQILPTTCN